MSPDKPLKLDPESVRTFLEFALKHIIEEQKAVMNDEEQKKSLMIKFVKLLYVSNSYLNCSRCTTPGIYRLNLRFYRHPDEIWICFSSKRYDFIDKMYVCYTYANACKLVNLLLPSYTGAYFLYDLNKDLFERHFELLKLAKGKLGLYLWECSDSQFGQSVVNLFSDRVHELSCPINVLMFDKGLQLPMLDYLSVSPFENLEQIAYVLQYKAKELGFGSISQNFAIGDDDLAYLKNETVKKLALSFDRHSYVNSENLVECLRNSCSNVKHLSMEAAFSYQYEFSLAQISNQVVAHFKRMNDLKTRLGNYFASMLIKFEVRIHVNGKRNSIWMNTVCKNSELNGWQIKSAEQAPNVDILQMAFDEAECKLKISIIVSTTNDANDSFDHDSYDEDRQYDYYY